MKTCTKCKIEKPKTEFYKHKTGKDGLRPDCKACTDNRKNAYRAEFPERYSAQNIAYHKANSDRISAYSKIWRGENPEKSAACKRNRHAMNKLADGKHTAKDVRSIFESQRGLCAACETKLLKTGIKKFHVDHIRPLSKGGSNDKYNLQCLCPTCNMRKSAKDPIAWAKENGKLL